MACHSHYSVLSFVLSTLCMFINLILQQPYEGRTTLSPFWKMRKRRHREVQSFTQCCTTRKEHMGIWTWLSGSRVHMLNFYTLPSFLLGSHSTKLDRICKEKKKNCSEVWKYKIILTVDCKLWGEESCLAQLRAIGAQGHWKEGEMDECINKLDLQVWQSGDE